MGTIDTLCVSLIVAMSVKHTFVAQVFFSTLAFRRDVINLNDVSILKEEFTPSAFFALPLKEFSEHSIEHHPDSCVVVEPSQEEYFRRYYRHRM
jgi:hypothetical protein